MSNDKKVLELQIRIAADAAFASVSSLKGEVQSLSGEFKRFSDVDGNAINGTFRNTQAAAERAATSMKLFGASGNELRNVQMQLKNTAVDLVAKGLEPQSKEVQKLVDEYKRLGQEADELDKATGQNIDSFGQLKNALVSLAEVAVFAKVLGTIKDMGTFALSTADTFQQMRNEFGILLGDMEAGAGLFNQIKAFNDKTPFALETLTQATNVLLAAKVPLSDLEAQLTKFGDLSQGNSQRLTSYIHSFSMAAAKGKADMQVLNTYLNQGVPILDALAKRFNVTTAEVVEMSSQGEIAFEDFSAALDDLTAAGGRYFGGMELGSQSLAAMQEGLSEAVNSLAASFGDMLLPAAINVVDILTKITNAIDDSPLVKGLLAGALVFATSCLGAMAVKAAIAFAHQMALNLAIGAINPIVLASTIAVAALAAGYVAYASNVQKATRESENFALATYGGVNALNDAAAAARHYADAFSNMSAIEIGVSFQDAGRAVSSLERQLQDKQQRLEKLQNTPDWGDRETRRYNRETMEGLESGIAELEQRLQMAKADMEAQRQGRQELSSTRISSSSAVDAASEAAAKAARAWRERWAEEWARFQGEQIGDPFTGIELERKKKLGEASSHGAGKETIDQINEYYNTKRTEIAEKLKDEETRRMNDLSRSKIGHLEAELQKELEAINLLEKQRVFAAGESEEEIAKIRKLYAEMREETEKQYAKDITKTRLEEARADVKDWQQTLNDSLTQGLLDLDRFSSEASVILGDLSAKFLELSASSALNGFEEFGRALGEGKDAAESLQAALGAMAQQILKQLPMMFLQAGLQLIANGQWAMGLGFIAASASTAIMSGYVDGVSKSASENAKGGIYNEYGKAAAFAAGGYFTNRIVDQPTYFRFASGAGFSPGVMGEAGPEAIVPLSRGPDGKLGISNYGGGMAVYVIIQNYTSEEVKTEESTDGNGNQIRKIIIGAVKESISSGEMDRPMASRYGIRAQGV